MPKMVRRTMAVPAATTLALLAGLVSSVPALGVATNETGRDPADAAGSAQCPIGDARLTEVMGADNWAPVTPEKWEFTGEEAILAEAGDPQPGPRRPFEYATLTTGREYEAVQIHAQVRLDTPVSVDNRDVIIVFGRASDTEYYYAHLSQDNTIYPHNGIFKVDNADRERIDDQWDGTVGAPPAVTDGDYHQVRLTHCPAAGEIAVYMDGADDPLMTATDTTFSSGRVGFGSFDNIGRMRDLTVTGTPSEVCVDADERATVVVGGVDTGVKNREADGGCSINDLVRDEYAWDTRGEFMRHVTTVVAELREAGTITGREGGAITAAAGRSGVPG